MRLTFQADRQQNVYHSLQEMRDFKAAQSIFRKADELISTVRHMDELELDWARTIPGKVIVSDTNLMGQWGYRYTEAELNFDDRARTADLTAELRPDDRSQPNTQLQMQRSGDDRVIVYQEGSKTTRLEQNTATGVFTIIED